MNKINIKCLRCHSNKLYKFDLDKQVNQKNNQCQNCNQQFAPDKISNLIKKTTQDIQNSANELT